jgi:hydroxylamine oxidation protein HaoB
VTGGLLLLGWFAYLWFKPVPAPYQYQLLAEGDSQKFSKMDLEGLAGAKAKPIQSTSGRRRQTHRRIHRRKTKR